MKGRFWDGSDTADVVKQFESGLEYLNRMLSYMDADVKDTESLVTQLGVKSSAPAGPAQEDTTPRGGNKRKNRTRRRNKPVK